MNSIDRRSFVLKSIAAGTASFCPLTLASASAEMPTKLIIDRRSLEVNGRAASVFGIRQPNGESGLTINSNEDFAVELINRTVEDTIIHWHGQVPPYLQDGVADRNVPLLRSGFSRSYRYKPLAGTHWVHSHHVLQEQALMAAPLIVRTSEENGLDIQEVTVILHDFSFRDPMEIFSSLTGNKVGAAGNPHQMHNMSAMGDTQMNGMDHSAMSTDSMQPSMGMDLNDVEYDAFLANDQTLDDPLIIKAEARARIRLRLINGAASTAFWIDLGKLSGTLVAVDGNPVVPLVGHLFPISMAQRLDIMVELTSAGAFPILAQVEGKRERTGFVIATPNVHINKISNLGPLAAPALDDSLEMKLQASNPLSQRPVDLFLKVSLTGSMAPYVWSMNEQTWPDVFRPTIRLGQRVVVDVTNNSMMAHPMHLHGHHFQVLALNGTTTAGAVRDTVLVRPNSTVRFAFDANNPGRWPFHCHNLYHMASGMMTEFVYEAFA